MSNFLKYEDELLYSNFKSNLALNVLYRMLYSTIIFNMRNRRVTICLVKIQTLNRLKWLFPPYNSRYKKYVNVYKWPDGEAADSTDVHFSDGRFVFCVADRSRRRPSGRRPWRLCPRFPGQELPAGVERTAAERPTASTRSVRDAEKRLRGIPVFEQQNLV